MQLAFTPPIFGHFIKRLNRFVAVVEHDGLQSLAHIATSGRLREILLPAAPVLLEKSNDPARRTAFSLRAVEHNGVWISVDAQIPNKLMGKALRQNALPPFADAVFLRSEPPYGGGRFDFLLSAERKLIYIEIKSVTLVEAGVGLFPDAPTERGRRHLELLALSAIENRAAVIFVIQRQDAHSFSPNKKMDPAFAEALCQACLAGVEVYAYCCSVLPTSITLAQQVPVLI